MKRWMNNDQRRAMFARMKQTMTNPYVVTPAQHADIDGDGVPMVLDVNPLGNMAMGTGLQVLGRPGTVHTGDRDMDGVNDMFDINPHGSYADMVEYKTMMHPPVIQMHKPDVGDRLAEKMMRLYPDGGDPAPIADKMKYLGAGLGNKVAGLWPDPIEYGTPLHVKSAMLGDKLAMKMASLYPSPGPGMEPLESRTARLGEGLAGGIARLWPG